MPIYEYKCETCGEQVEELQHHEDPPPPCPKDSEHGPMTKQISETNFKLEGSGWASDGYSG